MWTEEETSNLIRTKPKRHLPQKKRKENRHIGQQNTTMEKKLTGKSY
jgi:hypothetical protein